MSWLPNLKTAKFRDNVNELCPPLRSSHYERQSTACLKRRVLQTSLACSRSEGSRKGPSPAIPPPQGRRGSTFRINPGAAGRFPLGRPSFRQQLKRIDEQPDHEIARR